MVHAIGERESFADWRDLKLRLLEQFRSSKQGTLCGQLLAIKQETTVEAYRSLFWKLVAPLSHYTDEVLDNTFMNGLDPIIKAEVECWRPVGLKEMMKVAQLVENRELTKTERESLKAHFNKAQSLGTDTIPYISNARKDVGKVSSANPMNDNSGLIHGGDSTRGTVPTDNRYKNSEQKR